MRRRSIKRSRLGKAGATTSIRDRLLRPIHPALLLLVVAVLAYGLLLPQLGFYWDELPMTWIRYELGPAAMTKYFSTNRPFWGLLYQVTTRLLPQVPVYWQVFALVWRWLSAVLVCAIVRKMWPMSRQLAAVAALAFLLYPGFTQQWTAFLYGHFFVVLCFLLFSFLWMIWSIQRRRMYWPLTAAGMLFSALNLWMMEYFYVLELFRPLVIQRLVAHDEEVRSGRKVTRILLLWAPYLAVFVANVLWRTFVFNNTIYRPSLLLNLQLAPIATSFALVKTIATDLFTVSVAAWAQVLALPDTRVAGPKTFLFGAAVLVCVALLVAFTLWRSLKTEPADRRVGFSAIALGVVAMLAAGWPFWLTGLDITLAFPANRFTLPFMFGVSLVLAGLLELAPPNVRLVIATVLLSLAAGRQALLADAYRRDWATQRALFWQMYWRAPGIQPRTLMLLNEGALSYFADNSLTAALNWIYDPGNRDGSMDYVLFYPTSRVGGTLQGFATGQPIKYDFIAEVFTGSTSQTLAFYFAPPGCLRLLDPLFDGSNHLIPDASLMREAAALSSRSWITLQPSGRMPEIYGPEPSHDWCYYFEQADLAGQTADWGRVASLGDQAFGMNDYPNDPVERFVFIEGYAHVGEWAKALDLSNTSYKVSKVYLPSLLCRLWSRIESSTADSTERTAVLAEVKRLYSCSGE